MSASSSSRSTSSSAGILRSSASQTTTAASQAGSDGAHVVQELDRAGAIDEGEGLAEELARSRHSARRSWRGRGPRRSHRRPCCRSLARPARSTVPVRSRMASRREVLPLWKGPTMAMHRGPASGLPFAMIIPPSPRRLLASARSGMLCLSRRDGKPRKPRRNAERPGVGPAASKGPCARLSRGGGRAAADPSAAARRRGSGRRRRRRG